MCQDLVVLLFIDVDCGYTSIEVSFDSIPQRFKSGLCHPNHTFGLCVYVPKEGENTISALPFFNRRCQGSHNGEIVSQKNYYSNIR